MRHPFSPYGVALFIIKCANKSNKTPTQLLLDIEKEMIEFCLATKRFNKTEAAKMLGIKRTTLSMKIRDTHPELFKTNQIRVSDKPSKPQA